MPDYKQCPECGAFFRLIVRIDRKGKVRRMSAREWANRVYCGNACKVDAINNGSLRI